MKFMIKADVLIQREKQQTYVVFVFKLEKSKNTGTAVKYAEDNDLLLFEMSLDEFKKISNKISQDVFDYIDPSDSIQAKTSIGGTALQQIKKEIKRAKDYLKK